MSSSGSRSDRVVPYWRNPRRHREAVEALKQSIEEYGYQQPIVVDERAVSSSATPLHRDASVGVGGGRRDDRRFTRPSPGQNSCVIDTGLLSTPRGTRHAAGRTGTGGQCADEGAVRRCPGGDPAPSFTRRTPGTSLPSGRSRVPRWSSVCPPASTPSLPRSPRSIIRGRIETSDANFLRPARSALERDQAAPEPSADPGGGDRGGTAVDPGLRVRPADRRRPENVIVVGHTRYKALQRLG